MQEYKTIGARLARARNEKGWSIREVARRYSDEFDYLSAASMSRYESGDQRISLDTLTKLARLLEKPIHYFWPEYWLDKDSFPPEIADLIRLIIEASERPNGKELIEHLTRQMNMILGAIRNERGRATD